MYEAEIPGKVVHPLGPHGYDAYVGRHNGRYGLAESPWANPYRIGYHGSREQVVARFEAEYGQRVADLVTAEVVEGFEPPMLAALRRLRGATLACWCPEPKDSVLLPTGPRRCHAQSILRMAHEVGPSPAPRPDSTNRNDRRAKPPRIAETVAGEREEDRG